MKGMHGCWRQRRDSIPPPGGQSPANGLFFHAANEHDVPGLLTRWLWEGKLNGWTCGRSFFTGFIEDSERLIQEVCCTAERDMNLLERLLPATFLMEGLKTAMLFIHDRLLRIQHETIDGCHRGLHFVRLRQKSNRLCASSAMIRMGGEVGEAILLLDPEFTPN